MKFMMNGALTIGTRDGATIEMAEAAGEDHFFLFGLSAEEVAADARVLQSALALRPRSRDARRARPHRRATTSARTSPTSSPRFSTRCSTRAITTCISPTFRATARRTRASATLYRDQEAWTRKAILNIAASGRFSSDRTIAEYARDIWGVEACPIESGLSARRSSALGPAGAGETRPAEDGSPPPRGRSGGGSVVRVLRSARRT